MQVYAGLPILTNQPGRGAARTRAAPPGRRGATPARTSPWPSTRLWRTRPSTACAPGAGAWSWRAAPACTCARRWATWSFAAPPDAALRREFERRWARRRRRARGASCAPPTRRLAARLDTANPRRVLRALEALARRRGRASRRADRALARRRALRRTAWWRWCRTTTATALTARIEARVDEMLAAGALRRGRGGAAGGPLSRTVRAGHRRRASCWRCWTASWTWRRRRRA